MVKLNPCPLSTCTSIPPTPGWIGFSDIKKLVSATKSMGMDSIALTDHGTMFGSIEFYNAARAAGIKPIIGLEAYLSARV